jgi:hypothetical protein
MDVFEYVAVLTSIIIGLSITHLLHGLARNERFHGTFAILAFSSQLYLAVRYHYSIS